MGLPIASGLKDSWKQKPKNVEERDVMGGLTDEHASSVRPKVQLGRPLKVGGISVVTA
jgi:hypothetical protein